MSQFINSLGETEPLENLSPAMKALWWLRKGNLALGPEWEKAHNICQSSEGSKDHDWVHALVHWIEGDDWNADYWYRRCGEARQGATIAEEWEILVKQLAS